MSLQDIIIREIETKGPISFHDFMEMCLYYPEYGYYTSSGDKTGKEGDFYTSPYLGPLFGEMIAHQLTEMWKRMGKRPFTIVEYGAGSGLLCRDILDTLDRNSAFRKKLTYCIIERSPSLRQTQQMNLNGRVRWLESIDEISDLEGCILSNELVDNFAVHQVVMKEELMEVWVDYQHGQFIEVLRPADAALINYFKELGVELPEDFRTEVNLQATQWIKNVATALRKGFVLTVDYGYPSHELYQGYRRAGNLVCYYRHQTNLCPYERIGLQDITTHVNFSALNHWGLKYGLGLTGYTTQAYFLLGLGIGNAAPGSSKVMHSPGLLKTLLMDLGSKMKVLIQQKNMLSLPLSGLRFQKKLV